ncbi:MAG: RNA polymerase sigma factor [Gaiellaceae bacterium]
MDRRSREIEKLYRARYLSFRNVLATITGSNESARDAVQEAFASALADRKAFRGESSLETWVWRIALRTAVKHRRDNGASAPGADFDPGFVAPESDPELSDAVRGLPPRRRLVVFLRYFGDLSYSEIAEVCDITEGTVAATLAQARAELRDALESADHAKELKKSAH